MMCNLIYYLLIKQIIKSCLVSAIKFYRDENNSNKLFSSIDNHTKFIKYFSLVAS